MDNFSDLSPAEKEVAKHIAGLEYGCPPDDFAARVMARIERRSVVQRLWQWFKTPRSVRIAPLWPIVAGVCCALFFFVLPAQRSPDVPIGSDTVATVHFQIHLDGVKEVRLIGSFNNWQTPGIAMIPDERGQSWAVSIPLKSGHHEYAFVADGKSILADPNALLHKDDGFGNVNSMIIIDENDYEHQHKL